MPTSASTASIAAINISAGGVPKLPVPTAHIGVDGVEGDLQADRRHHGGPDQHLCLYSTEVIEALQAEGHPIAAGNAGENLTISGLDWSSMHRGARLAVGVSAVIEVTHPAAPCTKNSRWFLDGDHRRMSEERHPGWSRWYAKVVDTGPVAVGDQVRVIT